MPLPEIMKLTILIGFSLVLILLLNNICIGSEEDTEENALKNEIKNEIINPLSLVVVWTLIGLIGIVVMYPILLLIPLIVAWIVLQCGTVALVLFLKFMVDQIQSLQDTYFMKAILSFLTLSQF